MGKAQSQVEQERVRFLKDAQDKANSLFEEIARDLIRPGVLESQVSKEVLDFAIRREPGDRLNEDDDIVFVDLSPAYKEWEADFGRTFVLGDDPIKKKLRDSLEPVWKATKARFDKKADTMTGQELYFIACKEAIRAGNELRGPHCGHLIGNFPHERILMDKMAFFLTKGNPNKLNAKNKNGNQRHWILEIHLVDRGREIGGFMEQLLTVD